MSPPASGPGARDSAAWVAVVGAGVGGLTAALSLRAAGFDVQVYEQAPAFAPVGAGVQVTPNASRVLHRLGLADEVARTGVRARAWHHRRWDDGRTLLWTPLGDTVEARFGFPHYQMHRADLVSTLAAALPSDRVHFGHRLSGLTDRAGRVQARFTNGHEVDADALVGADGVHSTVRRELFGPQEPHFTGCAAYRGVVPTERLRSLDLDVTSQIWLGPGRHFVNYFVSGRRLVNFVAVVDEDQWVRESWSNKGDPADAVAAFEGWHPVVRSILESLDEVFVWALLDRPPMPLWSVGTVTLLGDACHPMLPFMAQSASQAIEDGATLAACLRTTSDIPAALRRYEQERIPRTSRVQALSAENKSRFHLPDGPEQRRRDALMATGSTDWSYDAVAWLYDHDVQTSLLGSPSSPASDDVLGERTARPPA